MTDLSHVHVVNETARTILLAGRLIAPGVARRVRTGPALDALVAAGALTVLPNIPSPPARTAVRKSRTAPVRPASNPTPTTSSAALDEGDRTPPREDT